MSNTPPVPTVRRQVSASLPPEIQERARALVRLHGLDGAARLAGVSVATFSKALADVGGLAPATVTHMTVRIPSIPANDSGAPVGA